MNTNQRFAHLGEINLAFAEALRRAAEQAEAALGPFADAFSLIDATILKRWREALVCAGPLMHAMMMTDAEREACYREYVNWHNRRRQWRKLSWRRLNRHQRQEALLRWRKARGLE